MPGACLSPCCRPRQVEGFTLIELMIVVAIIGILAAVAIPSFMKHAEKAKENAAKISVYVAYKAAKAQAVDNTPQGVWSAPPDIVTFVKASEPQLDPLEGLTPGPDHEDVAVSLGGANLVLCSRASSGAFFTLVAPPNAGFVINKGAACDGSYAP